MNLSPATTINKGGDMSMAQRYASYLERESYKAERPLKAETLRQAARKIVEMDRDIQRLKNQVAVAKDIVNAGVELMTREQIGRWRGVRSFLEQDADDYEPFDTTNDRVERPCAASGATADRTTG